MATELGEDLCLNPGFSEAKSKLSALLKCYVLCFQGERKGTASKGTLEAFSAGLVWGWCAGGFAWGEVTLYDPLA